jgi:hypothetical protein
MTTSVHHTIEIWNENGKIGKYDAILFENNYRYWWANEADQHFTFPRPSVIWHVLVIGRKITRSDAEKFVLAAESGNVNVVKLVQE